MKKDESDRKMRQKAVTVVITCHPTLDALAVEVQVASG